MAGRDPAPVIDTVDWSVDAVLNPPQDLAGSRLQATMRPEFGGDAIAELDSATGGIVFGPPSATGLTERLTIKAPIAVRKGWLADRPMFVFFDIRRTVAGSNTVEWLARVELRVLPGSDSPLLASASAFRAPLAPANGRAEIAVFVRGPQGPRGDAGGALDILAGTALSGHRVVRAGADGRAVYASNAVPGDVIAALGVTTGAAEIGAPAVVVPLGDLIEPTWSWIPGQPVWCGPNGALMQPAPIIGDLRQVGLALTPTRLAVALGAPILRI